LRGFGGLLIPLALFPPVMQEVLLKLPFAQVYYVPVQIWLGRFEGPQLLERLAWQWGWVLVLFALSRIVMDQAQKKVTLVGG
jgi:ABC-2 type transport system permease protein